MGCGGTGSRLPPCPENTFEVSPVQPLAKKRDCQPFTTCIRNVTYAEKEIKAPTPNSDRICKRCFECPLGQFEETPCQSVFNGIDYDDTVTICKKCSTCEKDEIMQAP